MDIYQAAVKSLVVQRIRGIADTDQLPPGREQATATAAVRRQTSNLDIIGTMVPVQRVDMGSLEGWLVPMVTAGTEHRGTFLDHRQLAGHRNRLDRDTRLDLDQGDIVPDCIKTNQLPGHTPANRIHKQVDHDLIFYETSRR